MPAGIEQGIEKTTAERVLKFRLANSDFPTKGFSEIAKRSRMSWDLLTVLGEELPFLRRPINALRRFEQAIDEAVSPKC